MGATKALSVEMIEGISQNSGLVGQPTLPAWAATGNATRNKLPIKTAGLISLSIINSLH